MDRIAAKRAGLRYYTGAPCRYGHNGVRYTSTGNCKFCLAERDKVLFSTRTFHGPAKDLEVLAEIWAAMQAARHAKANPDPRAPQPWPSRLVPPTVPTPAPSPEPDVGFPPLLPPAS